MKKKKTDDPEVAPEEVTPTKKTPRGAGVVTITDLTRRFDKRADVVLAEYLEPLPREKGEQRAFRIKVPLPNYEHFVRMQAAVFRRPLTEQHQWTKRAQVTLIGYRFRFRTG